MSSLQKFHRRTAPFGPAPYSFTSIGSGDATHGFWLGTAGDGTSKLIVAPKSTEGDIVQWGSYGVFRNTTSTTDGLANTNTLASFGTTAHPPSRAKFVTTGGYNTWYCPAKDELITLYSNKSATPFATADSFIASYYWSSTESTNKIAWIHNMVDGTGLNFKKDGGSYYVRAVRRVV